jgi:hypothetical protein
MKARTIAVGFVAALALALALPAFAAGAGVAGSVVPPENSAATQYTEAIPTAGGDKPADGGGKKASPAKVLGTQNAHKLESHGKQGREVAEVVAETAPTTSPSAEETSSPEPRHAASGSGNGGSRGNSKEKAPAENPPQGGNEALGDAVPVAEPAKTAGELPSGSSGLGEVLAEATGSSSSGQLGALLPLAILAAIAWSLVYFRRQRRPAR